MENQNALKSFYGAWINGEEVPAKSGKVFEVRNPANGDLVAHVAEGDKDDVEHALNIATEAFEDGRWSNKAPRERGRILTKAAQLLRDRLEYIIKIEVLSTGRAIKEMRAQIPRVAEWLEYFGAMAQTVEGGVTPFGGDFVNYYRRIPLGVVGLITPWNHPLLIAMKKVAPALAAGNCLVVKPSELAPIAVIELGKILHEAGVPPGVVNIVPGFGMGAGKALSDTPRIARLDITGGTVTGRVVAASAGRNLVPVAAELGGKAPLIVFEDSDIEEAVNAAAFASFIATGQTCIAATRLLVHEAVFEEFKAKLAQKVSGLKLGDPMDPTTQIGPVISAGQRKRIEEFVDAAKKEGARILVGGSVPSEPQFASGHYYLPTLIADVTPNMTVVREEVFGPVVVILSFKDEVEAVTLCNDSPYGLAAGVWTNDVRRAHRVAHKLRVGIVWINDYHKNDPSSPWGGMKDSGFGRENGYETYMQYSQTQSVVVNYSTTKSDWFGNPNARYN